MVLTYKISPKGPKRTIMCIKSTNFNKNIKATTLFVVFLFVHSWEQRKLGDYFIERNERSGDGEMISVTINSGIRKFDELNRHDTKPDDLSKYKRVEIGDIAYNSMRMWQGASGYSPYSGILSPAYTVITPKEGVSSRFFAYLIKRPKTIHLFEINSQGLTKDTWNLKFPAFAPIEVKAPVSYEEQVNISRILIQLDNLITLHQRKDFSHFSQILRREKDSFLPTSWEQRKLGEVAIYRRGSFPQPYGKKEWYDGNGAMSFVQVADVTDEMNLVENTKQKISTLAQPMSVYADKNSVLVTLQGSIGRVAITQYGAFIDRTVLIFEKYKEPINILFWVYSIKQKFIEEAHKAPGGTIKTITKEALSDFDLLLPKYDEQSRVGAFFKQLDNLITLHQCKVFYKKVMFYKKPYTDEG